MSSTPSTHLRLRDQVRRVIRLNRYSVRTEKSYWYWTRYYIRFHGVRHPQEMGAKDIREFLTWPGPIHTCLARALLEFRALWADTGVGHATAPADFSHRSLSLARVRSLCQSVAGNRVPFFGE